MESPFSPGLSQRPDEDWGEWGRGRAGSRGGGESRRLPAPRSPPAPLSPSGASVGTRGGEGAVLSVAVGGPGRTLALRSPSVTPVPLRGRVLAAVRGHSCWFAEATRWGPAPGNVPSGRLPCPAAGTCSTHLDAEAFGARRAAGFAGASSAACGGRFESCRVECSRTAPA